LKSRYFEMPGCTHGNQPFPAGALLRAQVPAPPRRHRGDARHARDRPVAAVHPLRSDHPRRAAHRPPEGRGDRRGPATLSVPGVGHPHGTQLEDAARWLARPRRRRGRQLLPEQPALHRGRLHRGHGRQVPAARRHADRDRGTLRQARPRRREGHRPLHVPVATLIRDLGPSLDALRKRTTLAKGCAPTAIGLYDNALDLTPTSPAASRSAD
jgi:hypothetical protein